MDHDLPDPDTPTRDAPQPKGPARELSNMLGDLSSSIKILEDRYNNLRKKTRLTDQNLIDTQNEFEKERKVLKEDLMDLKVEVKEMKKDLEKINDELKDVASRHEVKVLEKYLDLWRPLNFITRDEAERIIEDEIKRHETNV